MSFYTYSVKELLENYFGENTITAMRKSYQSIYREGTSSDIIPSAWQYADEEARSLFLNLDFYLDTLIEEDFIVYLFQRGSEKKLT